ncbi:ABC transporter permease [Salsipaludibacter albus]|uniref:ABC transporter permease n=1 Tax=Salsipaludibacter albus TaxID=2849650 RepID=UPI001EE45206|nr:ABC transporter permease [Salsipaludibacter albus]MBY5163030.1 ABC transporter permease [Salsipaludibacter albus]
MSELTWAAADGYAVARRNLIKIKRVPELLIWILMSPIMFVLLFVYVFGGAIDIPGVSYREWLIAGIFAQTVVFGSTFTGAGLAEDMEKGIIDRFRSLPMSRSAVIVGRTASDIVYNVLSITIMSLTGLLVGWRIHTSVPEAAAGFLLLLAFSYAFSWIMAWVAMKIPSVEVINNASFMVIMPLTFISNAFVPLETFPAPLQVFAEWNPVSSVTQAARDLFGNAPTAESVAQLQASGVDVFTLSDAWSLTHPVAYTLLWIVGILVVFVPLSVRAYRHSATK